MSKSILQRAAVIFAGPFMNYVLAIVLLIGVVFFGGRPVVDPEQVVVGEVTADAPADRAGLKPNDVIIAFDGLAISNMDSLRTRINARIEQSVTLTWVHESDTLTAEMVTIVTSVPNADGGIDSVGIVGFSQQVMRYDKVGFLESVQTGFVTAHVLVAGTVQFLGKFVTGEVSVKAIGGPLFIAQQSGREARRGASSLFIFMALLSINLAILNVLPIPILDGGHLCFLIAEAVRGGPLPIKVRVWAQQVGLVMSMSLILFVTYNDVLRFVQGYWD